MNKRFGLFVVVLFLLCATVGTAQAITTDFEDLTSSSWGQIPEDYAGLHWPVYSEATHYGAWTYWDVPDWYEAGSGSKIAYWNGSGEAWIEFGQDVTFKGSWIDHDPYNVGLNESWWEGYKNGVKIYESEHYTSDVGRFLSVNWPGVDAVQLKYTVSNLVIIDDLTFEQGQALVAITIDIKPGSAGNPVNPRAHGVLPVAILTTEDFDASKVDVSTVQFGQGQAQPVHYALKDLDSDTDWDLVLQYKTQDTGIVCGATEVTLTGKTLEGVSFTGTDSVRTVGCK